MNVRPRIVFASMLFLVAACGGSQADPESACKGMFEAMKDGDVEEVLSYLNPKMLEEPGARKKVEGLLEAKIAEFEKEKGGLDSMEVTDVKIDGDKARVKTVTTYGDGSKDTDTARLIEIDGKWYMGR